MEPADWLVVAQNHFAAGRLQDAELACRETLRGDPGNADGWVLLARLATVGKNLPAALDLVQRAKTLQPNSPEVLSTLGTILFQSDRLAEAQQAYEAVVALAPNHFMSLHNLGVINQRKGDFPASAAWLERALALMPSHALTYLNLGVVLRDLGRFSESTARFQTAAALDPRMADAFMQQAWNALLLGDYARGWPLFEWRWRCGGFSFPQFSQSVWDGSPLVGRSIMLHAEQGIGDTIQFSRYATHLAQGAGEVTIYTPETLRALLATVPGATRAVSRNDLLPQFDVWCPMMSLPLKCGTTVQTIPAANSYVTADAAAIEQWRSRLSQDPAGFRVGICWAGNPSNYNDVNRSIPPDAIAPLAAIPGVAAYSLQVGATAGAAARLGLIDHTAHLANFVHTAALMMNLDLIISVDTACAHLAGALGRKIWTLVPFAPEWRWMLDRPDSPWYPTMRIIRRAPGSLWPPVVAQVADDLRMLVSQLAG